MPPSNLSLQDNLPPLQLRVVSPADMAKEYSDVAYPHPGTKTHYLVLYAYDPNYIQAVALSGPPFASTLIEAYDKAWHKLTTANTSYSFLPQLEITDNVISETLGNFFATRKIQFTLVPTNDHRANRAERAIQTWKKALIAALNTAHPDLPLSALPYVIAHLNVTINLLRTSRINPTISAYEQLH